MTDEIIIDWREYFKTITISNIEFAIIYGLKKHEIEGSTQGAKKLGRFGASCFLVQLFANDKRYAIFMQ